jgi:SET domain-containing protein
LRLGSSPNPLSPLPLLFSSYLRLSRSSQIADARTRPSSAQFGEHSELALDAKSVGNEARFVNDYRNTGKRANVEFRLRRDARGEMRQGVFVCAKEGVHAGEELLISYGKSYWTARVGDLESFITRRPGEAAHNPARAMGPSADLTPQDAQTRLVGQ